MLVTQFVMGFVNYRVDHINEYNDQEALYLYFFIALGMVVLAFYIAMKRLRTLNRTKLWSLLLIVPFGWIVIACMTEKDPKFGRISE